MSYHYFYFTRDMFGSELRLQYQKVRERVAHSQQHKSYFWETPKYHNKKGAEE